MHYDKCQNLFVVFRDRKLYIPGLQKPCFKTNEKLKGVGFFCVN